MVCVEMRDLKTTTHVVFWVRPIKSPATEVLGCLKTDDHPCRVLGSVHYQSRQLRNWKVWRPTTTHVVFWVRSMSSPASWGTDTFGSCVHCSKSTNTAADHPPSGLAKVGFRFYFGKGQNLFFPVYYIFFSQQKTKFRLSLKLLWLNQQIYKNVCSYGWISNIPFAS